MSRRPLTHRQLEVLELVARGLTNADIARVLGISLGTAKHHVSAVIEALDVSNRAEAAASLIDLKMGQGASSDTPLPDSKVPGFGDRPLLALLPIEDVDGHAEDVWFARGLLTDLTRRTGRLRWFPVIHQESALATSTSDTDQLKARYHAQGSVVREGKQLFLTLRVVDAVSSELVWADRFDANTEALDQTQEEIVLRIAHELEPAILAVEQVRGQRSRAARVAVWEFCKRAEYNMDRETLTGHRQSVALFERALAIDADSPEAWAGLAGAHSSALYLGFSEDRAESTRLARRAAERALDLAPEDAEVQFSIGRTFALSQADSEALPFLKNALELNPSSSIASNTLAGALRRLGRIEEAIPWYERTLKLSPLGGRHYHVCGGLALAHLSAGRDEEALDWARKSVESEPARPTTRALDFWPVIPASLALLGRVEEARAVWKAGGVRRSRRTMRHSARFTGEKLERLIEGLRLAGWSGDLD